MHITFPFILIFVAALSAVAEPVINNEKADGYKGIWFTLGQFLEHGDKYSGGLGTYTAKHTPLAVYAPEVDKTFFVYGGTRTADERYLLCMASFYDHATGTVPKPTIVHDKAGVNDPHDNPSISIADDGCVWVFVSGRGRKRPGFIYRSTEPYSVDAFERVRECEMTYPQPWHIKGKGFLLCFTKYTNGRELYWTTSNDGRTWAEEQKLAGMGGHYQTSREKDGRIITAFNYHPGGDVDKRTNLYYAETSDLGATWKNAAGETLATPLETVQNPALVRDYAAEGRLVYMKDINFDAEGRPVILIITSGGYAPGPESNPRIWTIVHWDGTAWEFHEVAQSDHNYDMGSLYIEADGTWRIIGPTEPGPQPMGTGGEMALWTSCNNGVTWTKAKNITSNSTYNHAYARRPVNAHPGFYAFWADGNPDEFSPSHLYFTNRECDAVWMLPYNMAEDTMMPERIQ